MITDEKLYETLSEMIAERNRNALDAFKLFINLYSAIVGGSIWLSIQTTAKPLASYGRLSTGVVLLVTFVAIILVVEAKRGWWGYRKAQSELVGKNDEKYRVPPPKLFPTVLTEGAMVVAMAIAALAFYWFNPLYPSN